jgi:hypothetical protein
LGDPRQHPRFELRVISRFEAMNAAEAQLDSALVAMVGGSRPLVPPDKVQQHLRCHFQVEPHEVQVCKSRPDDFLLIFVDRNMADRVLHTPPPRDAELTLRFRRWTRQSRALFSLLRFKVLLSIENIPVHAWSLETTQHVVGSSCMIVDTSPRSLNGSD